LKTIGQLICPGTLTANTVEGATNSAKTGAQIFWINSASGFMDANLLDLADPWLIDKTEESIN